jgi:hypothetical protein
MTAPQITRRTFLAATTVAVAARPATATAAATPAPRHPTRSAARQDITTQQGNASITVYLVPVQDVTAINYTITNIGVLPDTFTVSTTDLDNGRQSRELTFDLDPGESSSAEVFGSLNHSFQLNVCQSDGTCFTVGPVGPAAQSGGPARGLTARPKQSGPTP